MSRPLAALSLSQAHSTLVAAPPRTRPAQATESNLGLDLAGMDRSVAPGDDFFAFANGTWLKQTEIPSDLGAFGVGVLVSDRTDQRTADLIKAAAASQAPVGSDLRQIGDFYTSFMDEAAIEARGLRPLQPTFQAIHSLHTRQELARYLGTTLRADVDVLNATRMDTPNLFGLWVAQDLDQPTRYSPFLLQGGLGLPERSYYLDPAPDMAALRAQYAAHVAAMLKLAGLSDPTTRAAAVVALETWEAFFKAAGLQQPKVFVVWQPSAIKGLAAITAEAALGTWKDYLVYHALQQRSPVLPKAVVDQVFSFYGKVLSGTSVPRDRWKYGVALTNQALGEVVGKAYVARYFPASEKARAQAMVTNIIAAFGSRIEHLEWMSPTTKAMAKAKLATLKVGVGYPDRWRDYRGLKVVPGDAFGNAVRGELFEYTRNLRKLGHPIDRTEWVMSPQTVNAVNLPVMNALNFPAAILQPPYFDPKRPVVMDYGAIGAVIGHEISHSFDDSGSLFDATGRLHNWWTPEDLKHFQASADQLVNQYDTYEPLPGLHLHGRQTLGENIADVAGLAASYDAYRLSLGGKPAPDVQGLSGDQQFFISYAQSWREKAREPLLRQQILTDGHAPAAYRPLTARNMDAWYQAFLVKPGQALYLAPGDRVRIW